MDLVAARLTSQRLAGPPATSALEVVEHLLAVQAQDERGARLAVRSRSTGLTAADVDRALTEDRTLIISWFNRGTLHMIPSADYWWLHMLTTPRMHTGNVRRLGEEGVSPTQADRGVEVVLEAVRSDGPQSREQLRTRLDDAGVPTAGQALVHVLAAASIRDHLIRGPVVDGRHAFVDARLWLGEPPSHIDRDAALAGLTRRYLRGHAPADARDLAKWTGLPLGDARRGFAALGDEADGLNAVEPAPRPPPRLLGAFDPLLHGWASREEIVGAHRGIVTNNGIFRPFALVDGRAVATWRLAGGHVTIEPLERIAPDVLAALEADADGVRRFLGG